MTNNLLANVRGIIFDYGGTIDSEGDHWSEVIFDAYLSCGFNIPYPDFRRAYIEGERHLARNALVKPSDNFLQVLSLKIARQFEVLNLEPHGVEAVAQAAESVARRCVSNARPILEAFAARYPLALVSNFYGNIEAVLTNYGIRHLFSAVIESAVVGIRKPDPQIFALGCQALGLQPSQVLVVGDSIDKDIIPAASLGCPTATILGRQWRASADCAPPTKPTSFNQNQWANIEEMAKALL